MEVVDIDLDNIKFDESSDSKKVSISEPSFGGGIELLMNEKKKSSSSSTNINVQELNDLEDELNDLSQTTTNVPYQETKQVGGVSNFGNMFNMGNSSIKNEQGMNQDTIKLGHSTKETSSGATRTWDGFSKVTDDVPTKPSAMKSSVHLTDREKRRKKRLMIKKLEEWAEKGTYKNGSNFTMESDFDEVEDEYEGALEEKRKKDSVKLQGWWFTTVVNTIEYGNALLNPFDLNLDGWGEQVSEDLDSYDEIFSELHEKYKGGKMAPEVSLLLRLGFSAAVVNMSNKMLSSATPGFNDVMKQSPELMKMFSNAAVETMSKQNPAFDFAKTMMNTPDEVNTRMGPPPAPVETKTQSPPQRPGTSMNFTAHPGNRPDLAVASNTPMFHEKGIDIGMNGQPVREVTTHRPEMKGPQTSPDLDKLLSGLKPKPSEKTQNIETPIQATPPAIGSESVISVSSLKDLDGTPMPKKSRRKQNNSSRNNTVSLDI
uniref:Uncharacterized protein n=1 Tax=viral metagenome TaxID=1070528 RepID=A0A6C0CPD4_9ZZZZ